MTTSIAERLDIIAPSDWVVLSPGTEWDFFRWDFDDWDGPEWRFAVEILVPGAAGSILGSFILGTDVLSSLGWLSVTNDVRAVSWERGSEDGSNEVGVLQLVLANAQNQYSPWTLTPEGDISSYFGVGTVIRVSVFDGSAWTSQVVGISESWNVKTDGMGGDRWVEIEAVETVSLLARYNGLEQTVSGSGDDIEDRINRLLDDAEWPYGFITDIGGAAPTTTFQSTNMAGNRLTEMYLTAASTVGDDGREVVFRSDRSGHAVITDQSGLAYDIDATGDAGVVYVPDSLETANDAEILINEVSLSARGGTSETYSDSAAIARFGKRTTQRLDLICTTGTDLDDMGARILAENAETLRPVTLMLHSLMSREALTAIATTDLGDTVETIHTEDVDFNNYRVSKLSHSIVPVNERCMMWTCSVGFRPTVDSSWAVPA